VCAFGLNPGPCKRNPEQTALRSTQDKKAVLLVSYVQLPVSTQQSLPELPVGVPQTYTEAGINPGYQAAVCFKAGLGRSMATKIKDNFATWINGSLADCSMGPEKAEPCRRLILLGPPGVGKGTQSQLLSEHIGACHLSTGDVFREAVRPSGCPRTPAMEAALDYMNRGQLVPDETVWELVRERSNCLHCQGGFLLDGFPRTLYQAEALNQFMQDENLLLSAVVNYQLPMSEIIWRLSGRRICRECKAVFHLTQRPPKTQGRCDLCNGELYQRGDDHPESISVRLEVYENSTAPLIYYYKHKGLLLSVDAHGTPEDIFKRTLTALEQRQPSPQ